MVGSTVKEVFAVGTPFVTVNPLAIVAVFPVVNTVLDVAGNVIVVESVPDNVSELVTANVLALVIVRVPVVVVIVRPLMLVAVAAPKTGVVRVGVLANTRFPVPVAPVDVTPSIVGCPVIVGPADKTMLPVPVTLFDSATPP